MKKLTEGNIWKNFILFAIPLVLSGLLSQAYTTIDTVIAGHYLGEEGLAANGATSSFLTFVINLFAGYLVGFAMYVARLFGEGAYERIQRAVWVHFLVSTVASLVVAVAALFFTDPLLRMLNVPQGTAFWQDAKTYFQIYMIGLAMFNFGTNCIYVLGGLGDSAFTFYMSLLSSVLNIAGNILTVTVLGMGVAGIAWSSVFSASVVAVFFILRFKSNFKKLLPNGGKIKWSFKENKEALPYSIPPILQQAAMYVSGVLLSPVVNSLGEAAIASYVVSMQIMGLSNTMYYNASRTVSNYTAQCLGSPFERDEMRRRLKRGIGVGLVQSTALTLLLLIPCVIFPQFTASIFFERGSAEESIAMTVFFQRVFLPFSVFNIVNNLFHGVFRAVKAKGLLISSTVFSSAIRIAVSYPLTAKYGLDGFWAGMVIAWIAEALVLGVIYRMDLWMPKEIR